MIKWKWNENNWFLIDCTVYLIDNKHADRILVDWKKESFVSDEIWIKKWKNDEIWKVLLIWKKIYYVN